VSKAEGDSALDSRYSGYGEREKGTVGELLLWSRFIVRLFTLCFSCFSFPEFIYSSCMHARVDQRFFCSIFGSSS